MLGETQPDPELAHISDQLDKALIEAAKPTGGAAVGVAWEVAHQLASHPSIDSTPGQLIGVHLVRLSVSHAAEGTGAPDPYASLGHALIRLKVCTNADLDNAFLSVVLSSGLAGGHLEAGLYDQLAAVLTGDDGKAILAKIERRA